MDAQGLHTPQGILTGDEYQHQYKLNFHDMEVGDNFRSCDTTPPSSPFKLQHAHSCSQQHYCRPAQKSLLDVIAMHGIGNQLKDV